MKYHLLILLFVLSLFSACKQTKDSPIEELDPGTASKGFYKNESLGWTMTLPANWAIRPTPTEDLRPGASAEAMRMKRKKQLLYVCMAAQSCNNSLAIMAQDTIAARGTSTTEGYYKNLIDQDEDNNKAYHVTGHYKKGTATFGGKEFNSLEISREDRNRNMQALKQVFYFRFFGPHLITIRTSYENEAHQQTLLNALNSSKFEKPGQAD